MLQKIFTILSLSLIALQTFLFLILRPAQLAFAQESTSAAEETTVSAVSPSPSESAFSSLSPSPTDSATPEPSTSAVLTPSPTPEPSVSLSPTPAPTSVPEVSTTPEPTPNESPNPPPATPAPIADVEQGSLTAVVVENTSAQSVESLDLDPVEATSAQLVTDKADYAPTDTAVISGTGLTPNTTYMLVVSSTDEPPVNFQTDVTADENGGFVYAYQLDGIYRPNYLVELKDQAGNVVAQTSFTDSPLGKDFKQCSNKNPTLNNCVWIGSIIQQSNSQYHEGMTVPQRLLLTNVPATAGNVHTLTLRHQANKGTSHAYDFITGYNQGNTSALTLNVCADFGGSLGTTCNNLRSGSNHVPTNAPDAMGTELDDDVAARVTAFEGLFGNRQIDIYGNSAITAPTLTFNGYSGTDEGYALYTLTWTSTSTDVLIEMAGHLAVGSDGTAVGYGTGRGSSNINGGPYHFKLDQLDGASLGSQDNQIKGADILIPPGSITLDKVTDPAGDPTSFTFTTTNLTPSGANLTDSSTPVLWDSLANGTTYTITENEVSGWSLTNASCSGGSNSTITDITNGVSITLNGGDDITCTFTNTLQNGHLIVHKVTDPSSDTTTNFSITASGTGTISGNATRTINGGGTQDYEVTTGTYSVSETPPDGWVKTGDNCQNVSVGGGETKECTITNTQVACYPDFTKTFLISGAGKTQFSHDKIASGAWKFYVIYTLDGGAEQEVPLIVTSDGGIAAITVSGSANIPVPNALAWSVSLNWRFELREDTDVLFNSGFLGAENLTPEVVGGDCEKTNTTVSPFSASTILKLHDTDGDGNVDFLDDGLEGWDITVTDQGGNPVTQTSDSLGTITYNFDLGTYTVSETQQDGWVQTYPTTGSVAFDCPSPNICTANSDGSWTVEINNPSQGLTLAFGNTQKGHIIVDKVTDPSGDPQSFSFDASGGDYADFSLTDVATPNDQELVPGSYSVSETVPPGWDLTNTSCISSKGHTETADALDLNPGETVTCTFTNQKDANIVVRKNTDPDGDQQVFDFDVNYGTGDFDLSDGQSNNSLDLDPGIYSIAENTPAGWDLTSATCDNGDNPSSVTLDAGQTVTCTFENQKDAFIIVEKQTLPEGDPEVFDFDLSYGDGDADLSDNQNDNSGDLAPGTYSVSENTPLGWDLTNTTCVSSKGDSETAGNISLQAGETVTCTFTNTKRGHVVVVKNAIPNNAQNFSFTGSGSIGSFLLDDDGNIENALPKQRDFEVLPGEYSVSETMPAGWQSESATCDMGETVEDIDVGPGETVTCTFENEKLATIILVKNTIGGNDTFNFLMTGDGLQAGTSLTTIVNTDSETFSNLNPDNTYTISELVTSGWALTDSNCTGTNTPASITPNAGEEITCTFTNNKPAAQIDLDPLSAVNKIGENHVITANVQVHNGNGSWGPAADGTVVTFSITNSNGATADFVPSGTSTCTTTGGICSITINSPTTGNVAVHASATPVVITVPVHVETGTGGDNSADAAKNYVNAKISIDGTATNAVDDEHTFTVTVEQDTGSGFGGVSGVNPTVVFAPGNPGTVTDNCAVSGTDGSGQCKVVINSDVAGIFTATASVNISVNTVPFSLTTNGLDGNSQTAVKTYVDASIALSPQEATNSVNAPHTITAHVTKNDGSGAVDAESETVTFSNSGLATFVGGVNTCVTNASGLCTVSINSSAPGVNIINATTTFSVGGVSLTRQTSGGDAGPDGTDAAEKTYVAGKIIVQKVTVGGDGDFDFTTDYSDPFQLSNGGLNDSGYIAPGTYSVSEGNTDGWDPTSVTCDDQSNPLSIGLEAGETVTCTFENTKRGTIIVEKQTEPEGAAGKFIFTGDVSGTISDNGQIAVGNLVPGPYSSAENDPMPTFTLASIVCDDSNSTGNLETRTANFNLDPGETVKCTFTNNERPRLTVNKIIIPPRYLEKDPGAFDLLIDGNVGIGAAGIQDQQIRNSFGDSLYEDVVDGHTGELIIDAGVHSISEQGTNGSNTDVNKYNRSISCVDDGTGNPVISTSTGPDDPGIPGDEPTPNPWDVTLLNGQNVTCTITNSPLSVTESANQLIIIKHTIGGDNTFYYSGTQSIPNTLLGEPVSLPPIDGIDGNPGVTTVGGTNEIGGFGSGLSFDAVTITNFEGFPADVIVTEDTLPEGWVFTSLSCTSKEGASDVDDINGQTAHITFVHGDEVTCTYTNTKLGSITGYKWHDLDGDTTNNGETKLAGWTIFIDSNGNQTLDNGETSAVTTTTGYTFNNLLPGTYSICEEGQSGWSQTNGGCQTVNLAAGQNVTDINFGNVGEREGTIGFWRNWDKHKKYNAGQINGWLATINTQSGWLMNEAGYPPPTGTPTTTDMVKLINDGTKNCDNKVDQLVCARKKFLMQYMVMRLNVLSGRKGTSTNYNLSSFGGAMSYLGISPTTNVNLGYLINRIEAKAPGATTQKNQFLQIMSVCDYINNQGI